MIFQPGRGFTFILQSYGGDSPITWSFFLSGFPEVQNNFSFLLADSLICKESFNIRPIHRHHTFDFIIKIHPLDIKIISAILGLKL